MFPHLSNFPSFGADPNSKQFGRSCLVQAALKGHSAVAHLLLHRGANLEPDDAGNSALLWALNTNNHQLATGNGKTNSGPTIKNLFSFLLCQVHLD